MSIAAYNVVWESSKATGSNLAILLALANFANDEGVCWPGIKRLALMANISARQVKRILATLEEAGELTIARNIGRSNTSKYTIMACLKGDIQGIKGDIGVTLSETEKVTPRAEKVTPRVIKGDIGVTRSVRNRQEPSYRGAVNDNGIYEHALPEPVTDMITSIAGIVKDALLPGKAEGVFESAAYALIGLDISTDQVATFPAWWKENGFYKGKPALKTLLAEIENAIAAPAMAGVGAR